jgi:hypothetical protein
MPMDRVRNFVILLMVAAIPAFAPPFFASAPELCFTAGPITYRLVPQGGAADYRVRIDNTAAHPDLRVGLADDVESADFALVDDAATLSGNTCHTAGALRTVTVVPADRQASVTISLTHAPQDADFTLFVHSARINHQDAAALFALMRHVETARQVAAAR